MIPNQPAIPGDVLRFRRTVLRGDTILGWVGGQTHESMLATFEFLFPNHKPKYKHLTLVKPEHAPQKPAYMVLLRDQHNQTNVRNQP